MSDFVEQELRRRFGPSGSCKADQDDGERPVLPSMEEQSFEERQESLRLAMANAVGRDEMRAIAEGLLRKAELGDVQAAQLVFQCFEDACEDEEL